SASTARKSRNTSRLFRALSSTHYLMVIPLRRDWNVRGSSYMTWAATALLLLFLPALLTAEDSTPAKHPPLNKFTVSYYDFSSGKSGVDVNLRHTFKSSTAWIAGYRESSGFAQARVGYEYDYHGQWLTFVPSMQAASRGFVGASVYAETGRTIFAIGG